jgi:hypothetical protein
LVDLPVDFPLKHNGQHSTLCRSKITSADLNAPFLIDPNYLSAAADLTALCAAVEHSRAIGSAACFARIPLGKSELR